MSYLLQYGSYVFPGTFHVDARPVERSLSVGRLPRTDGGRLVAGRVGPSRISVAGSIVLGPLSTTSWQTRMDALMAALNAGPAALYAGENDRLYNVAHVAGVSVTYSPTQYGKQADVGIEFASAEPFKSGATITTDETWTSPATGATKAFTPAGNAFCEPTIMLRFSTGGTIAAGFENVTTGEAFTLAGTVTTGDTVRIDCSARTVRMGTAAPYTTTECMALFEGEFIRLLAAANTLKVTYTSGVIDRVGVIHQGRWA